MTGRSWRRRGASVAGKAQKPTSQLQNPRGGRGERRTFPILVPEGELVAPPAPKGLRSAGREAWERYWTDPVCCAATRVDGYDIARYCQLLDRRATYERRLAKSPTQLTIAGERPAAIFLVVKELTREIEKLREQLGILPLARMRLGLVQTQRDIGRADLLRRLERSEEAREALEDDAIEGEVVNLDELA